MAFCPKCGASVPDGAKFCAACGSPLAAAPIEAPAQQVYQAPVQQEYQAPVQQEYQPAAQQEYQQAYQQQGYQQTYQPEPKPVDKFSIRQIYTRAIGVLMEKPIRLWGLSLLGGLLGVLVFVLTGLLPIVALPLVFVLEMGMYAVYLDGIRKKDVASEQLFTGFKKGKFLRYAGGMGWMVLWILIWALIPIVGIVFAIIKAYSYRFTPYIMLNDDEITPMAALRRSMEMTKGLRGKMFGADIIVVLLIFVAALILSLLSLIPVVGVLFTIISVLFFIVVWALLPLFNGLVQAAFYDEKAAETVEEEAAAEAE